jgi:RNA polymerase sigma-70 factor (ECF subfamily)
MKREHLLWEQFVKGQNEALGELYSEFFEPLVFVSFYLVKDNEVARDIVGELFVSILSVEIEDRQMKWEHVNTVKSYLSTAVKNKSIDYLRKTKLHLNKIEEMLDGSITIEDNPFFDESLMLLREEEKEVFQLHLDGYKNEEIAQKQQLTEKTVRNKLSLTRKKMRTYFKSLLIFFT